MAFCHFFSFVDVCAQNVSGGVSIGLFGGFRRWTGGKSDVGFGHIVRGLFNMEL